MPWLDRAHDIGDDNMKKRITLGLLDYCDVCQILLADKIVTKATKNEQVDIPICFDCCRKNHVSVTLNRDLNTWRAWSNENNVTGEAGLRLG